MAKSLKHIEIEVESFEQVQDLSAQEQKLLKMAKEVATKAYAPYSHFNVGAALLLENGSIVTGSNQENAAYPSGLCAERVAMFAAGATFPGVAFKIMVVYAHADAFVIESPVTPCGACRQVMAEYEDLSHKIIRILMANDDKILAVNGISSLLPLRFQLPSKK